MYTSALSLLALVLASEAEAEASELDAKLMTVLLVPPATPFFVYDIIVASLGCSPSFRWALAETLTTGPPVLLDYTINAYSQAQLVEPVPPFYLLFLGPLSGLPLHGILALAEVNLRPSELFASPGGADDRREEHIARFDADFASSIALEIDRLVAGSDRLVVCSSPRMLGRLRDAIKKVPGLGVDELARDLVKLTPSQIREQLATYGLLPPQIPAPALAQSHR